MSKQAVALQQRPEIQQALALVERLRERGTDIELPEPPGTDDPAQQRAWLEQQVQATQAVIDKAEAVQGYFLLQLRETLAHGEARKLYESLGIGERVARERIQAARFLLQLDEPNRRRAADLSRRRLLRLARLGPDFVEQLEESGQLDEIAEMSDADFKVLTTARNEARKAREQLDRVFHERRAERKTRQLKESLLRELPPAVIQGREFGAMAANMGMELSLRGQMVFDQMCRLDQLHSDPKTRALQFRQGSAAIFAGVDAALKSLLELREHMREHLGEAPPAEDIPALTKLELDAAFENYRWLLRELGEQPQHIGVAARRGRKRKD